MCKCIYCKFLNWKDKDRYGDYWCLYHGHYQDKGGACIFGEEEY